MNAALVEGSAGVIRANSIASIADYRCITTVKLV